MKNTHTWCYPQRCLDWPSGALARLSSITCSCLALPVHLLPLRSAFYAHFLLGAKMNCPFCTNSETVILCQKAGQGEKTPAFSPQCASRRQCFPQQEGFQPLGSNPVSCSAASAEGCWAGSYPSASNEMHPEIHASLHCLYQDVELQHRNSIGKQSIPGELIEKEWYGQASILTAGTGFSLGNRCELQGGNSVFGF